MGFSSVASGEVDGDDLFADAGDLALV